MTSLQNKNVILKSFPNDLNKLVNNDNVLNSLNEVFPYKEAFSPYLIEYLRDKFDFSTHSLYDPFCGVGSSFLNSKIQFCYGFDISPFVIGVANAKLKKLNSKDLNKAENITRNFKYSHKNYDFPKWESFNKYATKQQFNILMDFIESFKNLDTDVYDFVRFLVFCNLEKILNYKRDGNGIKYRESKIKETDSYLKNLSLRAFELKRKFDGTNTKILELKNISSVTNKPNKKVDCILTSPPYANLFDYFEIYKMELWSSGIIKNYEEWKKFKKSALRNNKNANLLKQDRIDNVLLNTTLEILRDKDLETSIQVMLSNYFFDMKQVLKGCFDVLNESGFCFIVVGNSCYKGVPIRTDEILAQEAQKIGFKCEEIMVARKLNTSSQQMKILNSISKFYLRESIIVLKKENK